MKRNIACLLLAALSIIILPLLFAQQDQITPKSNPEVEALKKRILELESKLQTVENVEKMELAAKLAEAQAKLRNAEFGKFKNELTESNNEWLKSWSLWFLTIIGIFAAILLGVSYVFWFWLRSRTDELIAGSVEKSLNGFKEAMAQVDTLQNQLAKASDQVNTLQNQIRILEKEHAASVLEGILHNYDWEEEAYPENVKMLTDEALLDLFSHKTRGLIFRYKAGEVLAVRKCPKFVSPVLEFLNSTVDSEFDWKNSFFPEQHLRLFVSFLGEIHTQETHEGLAKLLDSLLLTEDTEIKDVLLTWIVFSLAYVSNELNRGNSVPLLKKAIPHLNIRSDEDQALKNLVGYFDRFNEPDGIKDILTNGLTDRIPEVETRCLELLQKHDPDFVEKWKSEKETANTENKESS